MLTRDTDERIRQFAAEEGIELNRRLGHGVDGVVYSTNRQSAVKGHRYQALYQRERDVYRRLEDLDIRRLRGFEIPRLTVFDDHLLVIEMTIVQPPFALDFAGAYLDQRPDYPDDVLQQWQAEKQEQFGENWDEVRRLMAAFARHGIYLADVKPGNIEFGEE